MDDNRGSSAQVGDGASKPTSKIVVMGVSGSGKSTVGRELAAQLGARFTDADDLHPPSNIEKMRQGIPLTDADRWPWLDRVGSILAAENDTIVIACSALRRCYRDAIRRRVPGADFVFLDGSPALLTERLRQRTGHFMGAFMLESQRATLEPLGDDEKGTRVEISDSPSLLVAQVLDYLGRRSTVEARDHRATEPGIAG